MQPLQVVTSLLTTLPEVAQPVVLLMAFQHGLAVYDLHDVHKKAVVLSAGGNELVLAPGLQATITSSSENDFDQINPARQFSYGAVRERSLEQGQKAFISQFSVSQALGSVTPLTQLLLSQQSNARKISATLLKTAVILSIACGH